MEIQIEIKNIYGVEKIYPVCQNAKLFASIANTKTLTERTVNLIRALGYTVVTIYKGVRVIGMELPAGN